MSEYTTTETKIKDQKSLVAALIAMGFKENQIEICKDGSPMVGYQGDFRTLDGRGHTTDPNKAMKGHVIVRRRHVGGASNDIGFVKQADGTYKFIGSAYDRHATIGAAVKTGGYNEKWLKMLEGAYTENLVTRKLREKGMQIKRVEKLVKGERIVTLVGYK